MKAYDKVRMETSCYPSFRRPNKEVMGSIWRQNLSFFKNQLPDCGDFYQLGGAGIAQALGPESWRILHLSIVKYKPPQNFIA